MFVIESVAFIRSTKNSTTLYRPLKCMIFAYASWTKANAPFDHFSALKTEEDNHWQQRTSLTDRHSKLTDEAQELEQVIDTVLMSHSYLVFSLGQSSSGKWASGYSASSIRIEKGCSTVDRSPRFNQEAVHWAKLCTKEASALAQCTGATEVKTYQCREVVCHSPTWRGKRAWTIGGSRGKEKEIRGIQTITRKTSKNDRNVSSVWISVCSLARRSDFETQ